MMEPDKPSQATSTRPPMSALGQKQTSEHDRIMSALPPKGDIAGRRSHVRFVPKADIRLAHSMGFLLPAGSTVTFHSNHRGWRPDAVHNLAPRRVEPHR